MYNSIKRGLTAQGLSRRSWAELNVVFVDFCLPKICQSCDLLMGIYSAMMVSAPGLIDWIAYDILVIAYYATKDIKEQFPHLLSAHSYTDRKVWKSNLCTTSDQQKSVSKSLFTIYPASFQHGQTIKQRESNQKPESDQSRHSRKMTNEVTFATQKTLGTK